MSQHITRQRSKQMQSSKLINVIDSHAFVKLPQLQRAYTSLLSTEPRYQYRYSNKDTRMNKFLEFNPPSLETDLNALSQQCDTRK
jgi:hypothetical protein